MAEEFVGAMSPETEKLLGEKLKFKNKILELVDDPLITIIDNKLLSPLVKKIPVEYQDVVKEALAAVVVEMTPIEI